MGGKPKLVEIVLIGLIQSVVAYIVRNLPIPMGLHTILLELSYIILIYFIARVSFWIATIGIIAGSIIYLISEIIVVQLMTRITGITLNSVINDPYMRIFFFIPIASVILLTIVLFKKYDITFAKITRWQTFKVKYSIESEPGNGTLYKEYLPAVIFIFLPIYLLFIINFSYMSVQVSFFRGYYSDFFKILFNGLIIILAFVSVWALRRISKSIEKEFEAKKAAETINQLEELILSIRKQRHDFNHHLQAVYGLMETGSFEDARKYIENTYHYVSSAGELIKTDNPSVSALLYTKIGIAETRNINFDISIECSLENFPLSSNEASSLLGNLIDNAFDEVDKSEAEDRVVRLNIDAERGEYFIEVANRGELDARMFEKIFSANFTTKEGHAGLGLTIVKEIVDKYKGDIQVSSGAGETIFKVKVPFRR